jgi:hypothetical protein
MAVDAVGRDVESAVLEPFDRDIGMGEGAVLDARVRPDPVDTFAVLAPKRLGVSDRRFVLARYIASSIKADSATLGKLLKD